MIAAALLLAQVPEVLPATPTTIIGAFITVSLSLVGLLVWVLRHVFLTTIPSIVGEQKAQRESNDANQAAQRVSNEKNLAIVIEAFKAEGAAERKQCADQSASTNSAILALAVDAREGRETALATVREHVTKEAAAYRHDLYDKLNEAVMGRELYLAQRAAAKAAKPEGA